MKCLILVVCTCFCVPTWARDKVIWMVPEFEPFFIHVGPFKGQGAFDNLLAQVIRELPEYQHEVQITPITRRLEALKQQQPAVSFSSFKNKSMESYAQFSVANAVSPPVELTMSRETWAEKWKSAPSIRLADVLKSGLVLGVSKGRKYGDVIDSQINDPKTSADAVYVRPINQYLGLAEMVQEKRIGATLGFTAELLFAKKQNPKLSSLVSVPLVEPQGFSYGYTTIPKGEWGDTFKKRVDAVFLKLRADPKYKKPMTDWFGSTPAWEQEYKTIFLAGQKD